MTTFTISHEIFVPRDIVYDLWSSADHFGIWFPALGNTALTESEPPSRLKFTVQDDTELTVALEDLGGTTRIEVTQNTTDNPDLPNSEAAWREVFAALENYLSAI